MAVSDTDKWADFSSLTVAMETFGCDEPTPDVSDLLLRGRKYFVIGDVPVAATFDLFFRLDCLAFGVSNFSFPVVCFRTGSGVAMVTELDVLSCTLSSHDFIGDALEIPFGLTMNDLGSGSAY